MFSEVELVFIVAAVVVAASPFDDDSAVDIAVVLTRSYLGVDGLTVDTTGSGSTAPVLGDDLAKASEEEVTLLKVKTSAGFNDVIKDVIKDVVKDVVTGGSIDGDNLIGSDPYADSIGVELFS